MYAKPPLIQSEYDEIHRRVIALEKRHAVPQIGVSKYGQLGAQKNETIKTKNFISRNIIPKNKISKNEILRSAENTVENTVDRPVEKITNKSSVDKHAENITKNITKNKSYDIPTINSLKNLVTNNLLEHTYVRLM